MSLDRQQRLQSFAEWTTAHITGDEKGQAQIFLDRLFQAFGQRGALDVGGTPEFRIKPGPEDQGGTSFADYVWKPIVLIEMKKRGTDLARHLTQAADYWWKLAPNRPQFTVLCNFDQFWIYDFNLDTDEPLDKLALADLPQRYDPLAFLFPTNERPVFQNNRVEVTRHAADRLAAVFRHMVHVRKVDRSLAQRFILQTLVALFAEDIDLLPRNFLTNLLAEIKTPEDSYDLLGGLFDAMNRPEGTPAGRFKGIRYFNGGLFREPAKLALDSDGIELAHLRNAARENWSKVSPDIFGTLFQDSMDKEERHAFGGHFTAPIDIMKIVKPTLLDPWSKLIDSAHTAKQLLDLLRRISLLRILDPACGSGNFLYIAYRILKRLEARIRERLRTEFPQTQAPFDHVNARQFHGMDIIPFAIELAKVTMMLARKLAIDELHISDEPPLPLDNLDANFQCTDALLSAPGSAGGTTDKSLTIQTSWPAADVIIGNPPFLGSRYLPKERGYEYQRALHALYPDIPKMADYCVYWFHRAHDHLPVCTPDRPEIGRAGLVGTQNIRNNQSRVGGLDHIVKTGVIVEAVDNQPWSGEANVHVSIANWVKTAPSANLSAPGSAGGPGDGTPAKTQPTPSSAPVTPGSAGGSTALPPTTARDPAPTSPATEQPQGTLSVSAGQASRSKKQAATIAINPAKLLIPAQKKLWFKVDPKLALLAKSQPKSSVTTTGKRGKVRQDKSYELDFRETSTINPALSDSTDVTQAATLICNTEPQKVFQGQNPANEDFTLEPSEAQRLLSRNSKLRDVIFPYMIGRDLVTDGKPSRYIIDFAKRDMLEASAYPEAFAVVKQKIMPAVLARAKTEQDATGEENTRWSRMSARWWQFRDYQPGTMKAIATIPRYIVCSRTTKRPIFAFVSSHVHPDTKLMVFPFADDYTFGVLQSAAHWLWFVTKCSKLKSDFAYTPSSVWDTFPWPQAPARSQIDAVAQAGREIRRIRTSALASMTGGLRALYRTLELPGTNPLQSAHQTLDSAVLAAYGFDPKADLLAQLLNLNLQVAHNIAQQTPVTPPGIPSSYGDPQPLITPDCIQP